MVSLTHQQTVLLSDQTVWMWRLIRRYTFAHMCECCPFWQNAGYIETLKEIHFWWSLVQAVFSLSQITYHLTHLQGRNSPTIHFSRNRSVWNISKDCVTHAASWLMFQMQTVKLKISLCIREPYCPLFVKKGLIYFRANSVALRSDCTDAHADLELHCLHMA